MNPAPRRHIAVMLDEVLEWLAPRPCQVIVDGTLGGGGHTRALAERVGPDGFVLALDRDPLPLERAEQTMRGLPIKLAQANFCDLGEILAEINTPRVDGILLDLGLSSDQLDDRARGFSFDADGPLDLRFDTSMGRSASQLIKQLPERELADMIYQYGEERYSRRIARSIVEQRKQQPIQTARELAELVRRCVPRSPKDRIDPATRTFQALRIAVNDELGSLEKALARFPECLKSGGRLAIISFHSLEDRRVKEAFRDDERWCALTKKPLIPSDAEMQRNPRARSAKLRVAQRV